jgi:hypothetical protein
MFFLTLVLFVEARGLWAVTLSVLFLTVLMTNTGTSIVKRGMSIPTSSRNALAPFAEWSNAHRGLYSTILVRCQWRLGRVITLNDKDFRSESPWCQRHHMCVCSHFFLVHSQLSQLWNRLHSNVISFDPVPGRTHRVSLMGVVGIKEPR